jgi:hypothetical protein
MRSVKRLLSRPGLEPGTLALKDKGVDSHNEFAAINLSEEWARQQSEMSIAPKSPQFPD